MRRATNPLTYFAVALCILCGCAGTTPIVVGPLPGELLKLAGEAENAAPGEAALQSRNQPPAPNESVDVAKLNQLLEDVQDILHDNASRPIETMSYHRDEATAPAIEQTTAPERKSEWLSPMFPALAGVEAATFENRPESQDSDRTSPQHQESVEQAWKQQLQPLRRELSRRISETVDEPTKARLETRLRILDLISDDSESALRGIENWDADRRDYWKHLLQSLSVSLALDGKGLPGDASHRSALALKHLHEAERHLASVSTLRLEKLRFCKEVAKFGAYSPFVRSEFRLGQEVLLYVEVKNIATRQSRGRFLTELQGRYEVFDRDGVRVASRLLPLDQQNSAFYRRDYFIAYRIYMPDEIAPGQYSLALTIEDRLGNNFGHATIPMRVKK